MKRTFLASLAPLSALVSLVVALPALAATYEADPSHSNVDFTVRHIVSKVNGSFRAFKGTFDFDDKKPENSKANFTVDATSIDTGNAKRDDHLRSPDFFDTKKFPQLSFVSTKFGKASGDVYKLDGNLTLHGVTKPVSFDVEFLGQAKDPQGKMRSGFTAKSKINRKDFGLTWNKSLETGGVLVGEEVELNIQVEGVLAGAAGSAPAKKN